MQKELVLALLLTLKQQQSSKLIFPAKVHLPLGKIWTFEGPVWSDLDWQCIAMAMEPFSSQRSSVGSSSAELEVGIVLNVFFNDDVRDVGPSISFVLLNEHVV